MRTGRVAWLFVVLLCGCRTASTVTSVSAPTSGSPRIPSQNPSIQRSPVYREAAALFEKKQFREAIAKLDLLTDDPDLTPADREFLKHQRQICVDAVSGKPTPVVSAPVPASTPTSPRLGDCGPRALVIVAQQLGVKANPAELTKAAGTTTHGASLDGLKHAAKSIGLKAEGVQMDRMALSQLDHPAIAWVDGNHYLAVLKVGGEEATIHDPNKPKEEVISTEDLLRRSGGILLTLRKD
jgi:hypothetical protein